MIFAFSATVLGKHEVSYLHCPSCGFLSTEDPYWLDEAYNASIAVADTGLVQRNLVTAVKLATLLYVCFEPRGAYIDVAGGYGMLVRLMRDIGFDFYWEDKFSANMLARGFEANNAKRPLTALTAFEVFEHVPDPVGFAANMMSQHGTRNFILSTSVYAGDCPPPQDWWYYAFETGQHVSFYQLRTLKKIADRLGLRFYSTNGIHIFTEKPLRNLKLLPLLMGRLSLPLAMLICFRLGSKTMSDHLAMLNR